MTVKFEHDLAKNESNYEKHGVDFESAERVFDDPLHESVQDRVVGDEERWQTVGMVNSVVLLLVAHTWKELDDGTVQIKNHICAKGDRA